MQSSVGPSPEGIQFRRVVKSFGAVHAVRGIDLSIAPGETVALLGPNGAGKSTTIDLLLGLSRPDSGAISVFGTAPEAAVRRGAVGAMLQTGDLIRELSVRELVTMMASLYPHPLAVDDVLALTGVAALSDRRTQKLSGGETQRVRFALALVADPDLLVLDEPTAALDVEGRRAFWATMRAFTARGKTVLFATHYLAEADAYADRVVLIARGAVVADGPPTEIRAHVGQRTIRATVPDLDPEVVSQLPGVASFELRGDVLTLVCADSDSALRALLVRCPQARDVEVRAAGLDEAFLELTGDPGPGDDVDAEGNR
jgi:ABC-2 type transport system ATP-binding protein